MPTPEDIIRQHREFLAHEEASQLEPFRGDGRPTLRRQAKLEAIRDWNRPPILVGQERFDLDDLAQAVGEDGEYLVEARDSVQIYLKRAKARIVARERAQVCIEGEQACVWAFDRSDIEVYRGATAFARDNSKALIVGGVLYAGGESRSELCDGATAVIAEQAEVTVNDTSKVIVGEQARVVIGAGTAGPGVGVLLSVLGEVACPLVTVLGPATVTVKRDSEPCVLLLYDPDVEVIAKTAPIRWWGETFSLTEQFLSRNPSRMGDPMPLLGEVRARYDEDFWRIETSAGWRPLATPRTRPFEPR